VIESIIASVNSSKSSWERDLKQPNRSTKEEEFVREQYSRYMDIVDEYVAVNSVSEINISNVCRSETVALTAPAVFSMASAIERVEVFDLAMTEVEAVIKSNLFADMLVCLADGST